MRTLIALGALALVAAGCAGPLDLSGAAWSRPDTSIQQVTQDERDCASQAAEAGWTPDLVVGGIVDAVRFGIAEGRRTGVYHQCMTAKGYRA